MQSLKILLLCIAVLPFLNAQATPLTQQRQLFQQGLSAIKSGDSTSFSSYYQQLNGYPLQAYLKYRYLRSNLTTVNENKIEAFLQKNPRTFYANRLRSAWLNNLAKQKHWGAYRYHYLPSSSIQKQCYYLQALMATKDSRDAFKEVPKLWLSYRSLPKACDPVINAWQQAGLLTDSLRHQRIMLALRHHKFSLAQYLVKSSKNVARETALVNTWMTIHKTPKKLLDSLPTRQSGATLKKDTAQTREIILYGIKRLAYQSPKQAFDEWLRLKNHYHFSHRQDLATRNTIGTWSALSREPNALSYFGSHASNEWRVRAALWQHKWRAAISAIKKLDKKDQQSIAWQYWLARSYQKLGYISKARKIYESIAKQRDYYSFLASDRLGHHHYAINNHPIKVTTEQRKILNKQADVQRLKEFYALDMRVEATREANQIMKNHSNQEIQQIATLTHEWQEHHQTILFLTKTKYWDAVDLRFPVFSSKEMLTAAHKQGLSSSWLMAIARQESAINPNAHSRVGARGLMQLMPATARHMAKRNNMKVKTADLYNPKVNITLGSAYLRYVLDKSQNNPVLTIASYNAGPSRVSAWLPPKDMDADIWIENIPYNETRQYVKNVLTYSAIYDHQQHKQFKAMSKRMPEILPKTN